MNRKVVILLSDKRSGSTFFEDELCKHPDIRHVSYTPHTYNETHYWIMAACLLQRPSRLFSGGKRLSNYGSQKAVRKLLIETVQKNVPGFKPPENDQELISSGWEALCEKFATPVFFEKSPQHPHHWAALDLMYKWQRESDFDVKFVFLYRNPISVLYSAEKLFHSSPQNRQFGWAESIRNILAFREMVGAEKFFNVSYESLVVEPTRGFRLLYEFMGLSEVHSCDQHANKDSLSKWKSDKGFYFQLDPSVRNIAKYLGYKDEEITIDFGQNDAISSLSRKRTRLKGQLRNGVYNVYKKLR